LKRKRLLGEDDFERIVKARRIPEHSFDDPCGVNPSPCWLKVKLTDGNSMQFMFSEDSKLIQVYQHIATHRTDTNSFIPFWLIQPCPRRTFSDVEMKALTLQQAGLTPRAVLIIEHRHRMIFANQTDCCSLLDP